MQISKIIIHCAASPNGLSLARHGKTAAETIDSWHEQRGFQRNINNKIYFNRHLEAIGYHFVINVDGTLETGRAETEVGAHVKGMNTGSLGICLVGTDKFTPAQWATLKDLVQKLQGKYPNASLHGHREFAAKLCPGFEVKDWVKNGFAPLAKHILGGE